VAPYPLIEEFNELEDRCPGRLALRVATRTYLTLSRVEIKLSEMALSSAEPHPTHRRHDPHLLQPLAERERELCTTLRSPIAMVKINPAGKGSSF
jgi:hypothetical protein